jgi:hypothetical protein
MKNNLTYDGKKWDEIPNADAENLRIKSLLEEEFPEIKFELSIPVYIGQELAYKKDQDEMIISNCINNLKMYDGAEELANYVLALKKVSRITNKVIIKYVNPIKKNKIARKLSLRPYDEFNEQPYTTFEIDGSHLISVVENLIRNSIELNHLKEIIKAREQKPQTYGAIYNNSSQTDAQYSKRACEIISFNLEKKLSDKSLIKQITISILEKVGLVDTVEEYNLNKDDKSEKIMKQGEYRSKKYTLLMRNSRNT